MNNAGNIASPLLLNEITILRMIGLLLTAALLIMWMGRWSDIDLLLADAAYDIYAGTFPWRHAWVTDTFNHTILKRFLMVAALGFIGYALADAVRPSARLTALGRMRLRVVALVAALVPLLTSLLKRFSTSHCPWDLVRYGGDQPYVRIFDALPVGALPGQCLPAGHASSALWVIALAVYWLPARPRAAWLVMCAGVIFGATVGFLQQLRGAHFLTHTLWSIWIACSIVLGVIALMQFKVFMFQSWKSSASLSNQYAREGTSETETSKAA